MAHSVRPATPAEAAAISAIARESWHAAYDSFLGRETVDTVIDEWYDPESLTGSVETARSREDVVFLVAAIGERPSTGALNEVDATGMASGDVDEIGQLVGFAHAGPDTSGTDRAVLSRIYVRPDRWGDGIGGSLLERVETTLATHFETLRLVVFADNEVGIGFYESTGFDRVDTRVSDLDDDLDEYVYEKRL